MSVNQTNYTRIENINNLNQITSATGFDDGYFYIPIYSNYQTMSSANDCVTACINSDTCVQAVFFSDNFVNSNDKIVAPINSCYLNSNIDMTKALRKRTNVFTATITSK